MVSDGQRRAYWIGALGLGAVGVGLLFWVQQNAALKAANTTPAAAPAATT